jgi:CHAD domain-containing protein
MPIMHAEEIRFTETTEQGSAIHEKVGIAFWMNTAIKECDRWATAFDPEAVHNIRVALRRCRSLASGLQSLDPDRGWKRMSKEAACLFKELGELRDVQVMTEWLRNPDAPQDRASRTMLKHLAGRELELKEAALTAISIFNKKKWLALNERLSKRAFCIPLGSEAFRHLAVEKWDEAHRLHQQALRNRSHISFHRLRIGLKKFRYILENFLPDLYKDWEANIRNLQDLLGGMHDLHVLHQMAVGIGAFHTQKSRDKWRAWIENEIHQRMDLYREKTTRKDSLWRLWRAGLPEGNHLQQAALKRLQAWASFRDPDCHSSELAAQLALQIYDELSSQKLLENMVDEKSRSILEAAALLHAVEEPGYKEKHRESYRVVGKLKPLIGWHSDDLKLVAIVVRYHRESFPDAGQEGLKNLSEEQRRMALFLSAILRLSAALAILQKPESTGVEIRRLGSALIIRAGGVDNHSETAQELNREKHLLEIACGLPIVIRNW